MKSAGLIVEYNPFHNGHLYHLQKTKQLTNADVTVAVMSGNFLQRGEPALVSKWARTKMALAAGVDIIIELPYGFAVQQATIFARGAVYLLNALRCDHICFGSERGEIQPFIHTIAFLEKNKTDYEAAVSFHLKKGMSYPNALAAAFASLNPPDHIIDLSKPNNILGYHYMLAAKQLQTSITFDTVGRKHANYHDQEAINDSIASATAIRKLLQEHKSIGEIENYIPKETVAELKNYSDTFGQFHQWENYWSYLQYRLLTMDVDELRNIHEMEEGIEHRLKRAAKQADHFAGFMELVKTKRYTWTRLQRLCTHVLTNTTKTAINNAGTYPAYARLLGMSTTGRQYLNVIKKELPIPLIAKASSFQSESIQLDFQAAHVYALGLNEPARSKLLLQEFQQPPIMFS
ncbi:nucleotidyltransferase [Bacillus sp. FJAT-50079]|uniref:nucleotidyltransferase n=1 Tax=Bacillus sp. FJAT-50079 TaxID=2833577 RepID=UPI001BC94702|nr:nucleotidyltransferase [Bacillus sp. FJAT-50079]MBS4207735.1 nucleotidyltransferase [Bacillus sp. FJAT-50079]